MLGRAAIAMWWEVPREAQAEFEDWHSHEHMPERLAIPGFLRGSRWLALSGEPSYFVLYEAAKLATIRTGAYLQRLNNPSAWSRKMMPYHRNMVRSLCRVRASFGRGMPRALASIRISPAPRRAAALGKWLATQALPRLPERKGLTGAHLLASQPMAVTPLTVEQRIRGRDAAADWVVLIGGYDAEAVQAAVQTELGPEALAAHGASPAAVAGTYGVAYVLTARDLSR